MSSFKSKVQADPKKLGPLAVLLLLASLASLSLLISSEHRAAQQKNSTSEIADNDGSPESGLLSIRLLTRAISGRASANRVDIIDYDSQVDVGSQSNDDSGGYKVWWIKIEGPDPSTPGLEGQPFLSLATRAASFGRRNAERQIAAYSKGDFASNELISNGMSRLLSFLLESNEQSSDRRGTEEKSNPFAEALTEAIKEAKEVDSPAASNTQAKTESSEKTKPVESSQLSNGSSKNLKPIYLFVGHSSESRSPVVTLATQPELNAFEFAGSGKKSFDLSILTRNLYAQESIAFGDLNADGIPDLVVTNRVTNRAYVLLGDGNNRYLESADIWGGLGPSAATIADFNKDGSIDLAVAYQTDKRIVVDGKKLRKFIFFPTSNINDEPDSLLPGDFNNDGMNDLIVMNYRSRSASIYLNQGDATFALSQTESFASIPSQEVKTDLNNDSVEDVILVQHLNEHVSVALQDGRDGSIRSLGNFIVNPSFHLVFGDFNLDGVVDFAVARKN